MGNNQQKQKVNFEDVQFVIKNADNHLLINTMLDNLQNCLIVNTMPIDKEELIINKLLNNGDNKNIKIIIYGKNSNDETPIKKYEQLLDLGFSNIYIYTVDYLNGFYCKIFMDQNYFLQQVNKMIY